jgi:hypothetical protein
MKRKLWWLLQSRYGKLSTREPTPEEVRGLYYKYKIHGDFPLMGNILNWFRYLEHYPPLTVQGEKHWKLGFQHQLVFNAIEKHYNLGTFEIITKVERL